MSVLRVTSFRAALAYTLALVAAVGVVLGFVFQSFSAQLTQTQDRQVWRETAALSLAYNRGGARALAQAVEAAENTAQGQVVRLSNALGAHLAGNLKTLPSPSETMRKADGWIEFTHQGQMIRARFAKLDEDIVLLVGYDRSDARQLETTMQWLLMSALAGLTLLGLLGGVLMARRAQARVAVMNADLQPVMRGHLDRRLPETGGDEWAQMAAHINTMLARLEQLMAATKQVSDNLAHDLRAPLTRLHMRLEKLAAQSDASMADELNEAIGDVDRLLHSFAALLTLSRLDSGVVKLTRRPIDITALVSDMHELFEAVFAEAHMTLDLKAAPVDGFTGDAALVQQALTNLLENVLTHAAVADTKVLLSVSDEGDTIKLTVADGGAGIAAEHRAAAQQRFVRLDASRSGDGSGLGLSLAAAIAKHHDGELRLEDNHPGLVVSLVLAKQGKQDT